MNKEQRIFDFFKTSGLSTSIVLSRLSSQKCNGNSGMGRHRLRYRERERVRERGQENTKHDDGLKDATEKKTSKEYGRKYDRICHFEYGV
jgi:hypothetical protein